MGPPAGHLERRQGLMASKSRINVSGNDSKFLGFFSSIETVRSLSCLFFFVLVKKERGFREPFVPLIVLVFRSQGEEEEEEKENGAPLTAFHSDGAR